MRIVKSCTSYQDLLSSPHIFRTGSMISAFLQMIRNLVSCHHLMPFLHGHEVDILIVNTETGWQLSFPRTNNLGCPFWLWKLSNTYRIILTILSFSNSLVFVPAQWMSKTDVCYFYRDWTDVIWHHVCWTETAVRNSLKLGKGIQNVFTGLRVHMTYFDFFAFLFLYFCKWWS